MASDASSSSSSSNAAASAAVPVIGSRKAYTGRVSKLLDNFGFIDDEVFFQLSVVRGSVPVKLNDQVYVECHYSDHLPFKWNALSVQVLDPNSPFHPMMQTAPAPGTGSATTTTAATKLSDPRQDPRQNHHHHHQERQPHHNQNQHPSSNHNPSYYRPDHRENLANNAAVAAADPPHPSQSHFVSAPSNTSRGIGGPAAASASGSGSTTGATFVSEYAQQQQQAAAADSNGLHGNRRPHLPPPQTQQPQQLIAGQFDSAYSRNSGITYTSTPGAAFVSTQIQPVFQGNPDPVSSLMSGLTAQQAPVMGASRGFPAPGGSSIPVPVTGSTGVSGSGRSSRWDPAPSARVLPAANAAVPVIPGLGVGAGGAVDRRNHPLAQSDNSNLHRNRNDRHDRDRDRGNVTSAPGKDRFGRDRNIFPDRETSNGPGRNDRSASGNRDQHRNRSSRADAATASSLTRSTESPMSTTGSLSITGRPENLPKGEILKHHVLPHDIRFRYGSKIHVPSDFEGLIVNPNFELDIQSIPKPIKFKNAATSSSRSSDSRRESSRSTKSSDTRSSSDKKSAADSDNAKENKGEKSTSSDDTSDKKKKDDVAEVKEETKETETEAAEAMETTGEEEKEVCDEKEGGKKDTEKTEETESSESKGNDDLTLADDEVKSKEETKKDTIINSKQQHSPKYGVKVILLSLPSMNAIHEQVFGYDFDQKSYSNGYCYPLNKQISFLAYRNQNDGYSMIGGKFDALVDGFLPTSGEKRKPDLIRTAIRCVKDQANIDLTRCSRWISLGTFVYNRCEDFAGQDLLEYSTIFMPDVWSLLEKPITKPETLGKKEQDKEQEIRVKQEEPIVTDVPTDDGNIDGSPSEDNNVIVPDPADQIPVAVTEAAPIATPCPSSGVEAVFNNFFNEAVDERRDLLNRIDSLKVTELKAELESRSVKLPRNAKKAELVKLLTEELEKEVKQESELSAVKQQDAATAAAVVVEPEAATIEKEDKGHPDEQQNDGNMDVASLSQEESVEEKAESKEGAEATRSNEETATTTSDKKRKADSIDDASSSDEPPAKKSAANTDPKDHERRRTFDKTPASSSTPVIEYKGDLSFSVLSLHQALNHHKHDHFELSISAELLREGLVKHFSPIIASCLKVNSSLLKSSSMEDHRKSSKTKSAPNYTQLAFSYIDDRQHGFVNVEDLLQLLSLSGYRISRKSWNNLIPGSVDRIYYKMLEPGKDMVHPSELSDPLADDAAVTGEAKSQEHGASVVFKNGIMYDIENLIQQRERYTSAQSELKDLQQVIVDKSKLLEEFESRQKKMTAAIGKQNDEICSIKREKDSLKLKNEELRKIIDAALTSLNNGIKLIKE